MLDPNDEILIGFIEESFEALDEIEPELIEVQEGGIEGDYELINSIFRAFHTMKGSAGFLDLTSVVDITHKAETLLDIFRADSSLIEDKHINAILETCDLVRKILNDVNSDEFNEQAESLGSTLELQIAEFNDPLDDSLYELQEQVNLNFQNQQDSENEETEQELKQDSLPNDAELEQEENNEEPEEEDYVEPINRPEIIELFAQETQTTILDLIKAIKSTPKNHEEREEASRHIHTLKGHLAFLRNDLLSPFSQQLGDALTEDPKFSSEEVKNKIIQISKELLSLLEDEYASCLSPSSFNEDSKETVETLAQQDPLLDELNTFSDKINSEEELDDEDFIQTVNLLEKLLERNKEESSKDIQALIEDLELNIQNHVDEDYDKAVLILKVQEIINKLIQALNTNNAPSSETTQINASEETEQSDESEELDINFQDESVVDDIKDQTLSGLDLEDSSHDLDDFMDFDDMDDFEMELPKLEINEEMLSQFISEGHDTLENAENDILDLLKDSNDPDLLKSAMRNVHTFKGNCGFFSFSLLQSISHQAETLLVSTQEGQIPFTETLGQTLLEVIDILKVSLNTLENEGVERLENQEIIQEILDDLIQSASDAPTEAETEDFIPTEEEAPSFEIEEDTPEFEETLSSEIEEVTPELEEETIDQLEENKAEIAEPKDEEKLSTDQPMTPDLEDFSASEEETPLPSPVENTISQESPEKATSTQEKSDEFYFVESPKTGKPKKKIIVVEDDESSIRLIAKILTKQGYEAHCCLRAQNALDLLKHYDDNFDLCISDINMPGISGPEFIKKVNTLYHDMPIIIVSSEQDKGVLKDLLSLNVQGFVDKPINGMKFKEMIIETFKKSSRQKMLNGRSTTTASSNSTKQRRDIRVDLDKLDTLINLVGELIIAESMVTHSEDLEGLELPNFEKAAHQLRLITNELQDISMAVRMVPIEATFKKMKRLIHDLSNKSGKKLKLHLEGTDTEVDKSVIDMIADPLVHMLRNSADHGVEDTEGRIAAGKSETGNIYLSAEQACDEVLLTIRDDGRGLNRDKILEKALKNNLIKEDTQLEDEDVYQLIFAPGFSTADAITDISGRGVGMDVVKSNIERVKGRIEIKNKPGEGCAFIIHIPLTLATIEGMLVRVGQTKYTIPINRIRESLKVDSEMITLRPDGQEFIKIRETILPVFRLHQLHDISSDSEKLDEGIIIVIELSEGLVCLFVDEILYQIQTVIKTLSGFMGRIKGISGCNILGNGEVALILDVQSLFRKQSINKQKKAL